MPFRFAGREAEQVPDHWRRFGARSSPISGPSPRNAGNPANAILNYLYAIAEAESRIAALAVGLDPGIGVMHTDLKARDSLACDLMEAIRPNVDEFALELIREREFRKQDFFETREGVCRILPPITEELVQTGQKWAKAVAPIAEGAARKLFEQSIEKLKIVRDNGAPVSRKHRLPTPLTESNRSASRDVARPQILVAERDTQRRKSFPRRRSWKLPCVGCGQQIDGAHRSLCRECLSPV